MNEKTVFLSKKSYKVGKLIPYELSLSKMRKCAVVKEPAPAVDKVPIVLTRIGALYSVAVDVLNSFSCSCNLQQWLLKE